MKTKLMTLAVQAALNHGLVLGALSLLVADKAAFDKLPKDVQAQYKEQDGKYTLDVEGMEDNSGLKSALQKERDSVKGFRAQMKELQDQLASWDGLDPAAVKALMAKFEDDGEAKLIKEGKIEEVLAKRTEKLRAELQKQVEEVQTQYEGALEVIGTYEERVLDNAIRAAAEKAGVHPQAIDDTLLRARTLFQLDDEGNAVQYAEDGKTVVLGKDGKSAFGPAEWLEKTKETAPHWFPSNNSGGGAHNKGDSNASGKRQVKRSVFDAMLDPTEKASLARDKNVQIVDG